MMIDLHCHVLHGIDDGAKDSEMALQMATALASLGFSHIAASPHVGEGPGGDANLVRAQQHCDTLNQTFKEHHLDLEVSLSAEHHVTSVLLERIKAKEIAPIGGAEGDWLLCEFPWQHGPDIENLVFRIQSRGYNVLLAHPERIQYLSLEQCRALCERGVRMQFELGSLYGQYGEEVKERAQLLISQGLAHVFASDMHRPQQAHYVEKGLNWLKDKGWLNQAMVHNPTAMLQGKEPEEVPPLR